MVSLVPQTTIASNQQYKVSLPEVVPATHSLKAAKWGSGFFKGLSEVVSSIGRKFKGDDKTSIYSYYQTFLPSDTATITPLVNACFESLRKHGLLDLWLKAMGHADTKEALNPTIKRMTGGLCHGYTTALINLMSSRYNASSENLSKEFKFEEIFFFQFWSNILTDLQQDDPKFPIKFYDFNSYDIKKLDKFAEGFSKKWEHFCRHNCSKDFMLYQFLMKSYPINMDPSKTFLFNGESINVPSDSSILKDYIARTLENLDEEIANGDATSLSPMIKDSNNKTEYVTSGSITLEKGKEKKKDDEKKDDGNKELTQDLHEVSGAHVLFFQFSEGHYRFHDSATDPSPGFFDYPTVDLFCEGLTKHIQAWDDSYKDGFLDVTILRIPKEKSSSTAIKIADKASTFFWYR